MSDFAATDAPPSARHSPTPDSAAERTPARTRFAPSPTGKPHIGNIRNAIFSYLIARHTGGQFVLRIEDTDRTRFNAESENAIFDSLRWLGLNWDEGPDIGGPFAPYHQSERLDIYRREAERLIAQHDAYYCYCTPERLTAVRAEQEKTGKKPGYDRRCRFASPEILADLAAENPKPVIRFAIPLEGSTTFHDYVRGDITITNSNLEDFVMLKSDGFPTYHLAHLVDDHYMEITHVVRSEEWLPSAPLHVNLYRALGWSPPVFLHPALILGEDGKKLSKRNGDAYVGDYREEGYVIEALLNFLVRLGWSFDDKTEIFSREDLIRDFTVDKIQSAPARFEKAKLDYLNGYYLNHVLSVDDIVRRAEPFLIASGLFADADAVAAQRGEIERVMPLVKEKLKSLKMLPDEIAPFFTEPTYDLKLFVGKGVDLVKAGELIAAGKEAIEGLGESGFTHADLEHTLRGLAETLGVKVGQLFMPLRVAITGRTVSPGLPETMLGLGRARTLARLDAALAALNAG